MYCKPLITLSFKSNETIRVGDMRLESQPVNMLQVAGHKKERSKKIYSRLITSNSKLSLIGSDGQ